MSNEKISQLATSTVSNSGSDYVAIARTGNNFKVSLGTSAGINADTASTPNTMAERDSSGNITANNVTGINHGDLTISDVDSNGGPNSTGIWMTIGSAITPQNLNLISATASQPGVVNAGAQVFGGNKTFTGSISASNLSGTNHGDFTAASVDSVGGPNPNGMTLTIGTSGTPQALNLNSATVFQPGVVNTSAQVFAGDKTFTGNISAVNLSGTNHGDFTTGNVDSSSPNATGMILTPGNSGSPANLQLEAATASQPGVLTATGTQTIGGNKTFSGSVVKLSTFAGAQALQTNSVSAGIEESVTTSTELGFVHGVTSSIQTQLNGKQASGNYITALTGDVTATGPGSVSSTIANSAVTNVKMANMAPNTIKGNNTGSVVAPSDLSISQLLTMLSLNLPATQVAYGNGASGIISNSNFTYNSNNQLTLIRTASSAGTPIILNDTTFNSFRNEVQFQNNGVLAFSVGHNDFSNYSYIYSAAPNLQLGTNSTEVAVFNTTGNLRLLAYGTGVLHSDSSGNLTSSTISNSDLSNMPANTIKGNNTGSAAAPTDLSVSNVISMLSLNQTANQICYGNGASGLTSSPNLTYTSNSVLLQGTMCSFQAYSTTGFIGVGNFTGGSGPIFAYAGSNANYFTNALAGDGCIRQTDNTKRLLIGVDSNNSQITISNTLISFNVQHSIGTTSPNAASIFQIDSTTQGFLPPRMTTTQKNSISSPPAGLIVFDTTLAKLCVYGGSAWQTITSI